MVWIMCVRKNGIGQAEHVTNHKQSEFCIIFRNFLEIRFQLARHMFCSQQPLRPKCVSFSLAKYWFKLTLLSFVSRAIPCLSDILY